MQEINKAKISMSLGGKQKREMSPRASSLGASEKRQLDEMPRGHPVRRFRKAALLWSVAALGELGPSSSATEQIPCGWEGWGCSVYPTPDKKDRVSGWVKGRPHRGASFLEGQPLTRGSWRAPDSCTAGSKSERRKRRASSCGRVDPGSLSSPSGRTWRVARAAEGPQPLLLQEARLTLPIQFSCLSLFMIQCL